MTSILKFYCSKDQANDLNAKVKFIHYMCNSGNIA